MTDLTTQIKARKKSKVNNVGVMNIVSCDAAIAKLNCQTCGKNSWLSKQFDRTFKPQTVNFDTNEFNTQKSLSCLHDKV